MVNLVNLAIPAILVKTFAFVNDMMFKILHRIDCKILKNCCRFIVCFHVSVSIATLWKYFTTMHARERFFSAPWKSLCYISWLLRLNNFPQLSHSNLLTSAWISLMCFFRTLFPQTGFLQSEQKYGLSSMWDFLWFVRFWWVLNDFSPFGQISEWLIWCSFKWPEHVKRYDLLFGCHVLLNACCLGLVLL